MQWHEDLLPRSHSTWHAQVCDTPTWHQVWWPVELESWLLIWDVTCLNQLQSYLLSKDRGMPEGSVQVGRQYALPESLVLVGHILEQSPGLAGAVLEALGSFVLPRSCSHSCRHPRKSCVNAVKREEGKGQQKGERVSSGCAHPGWGQHAGCLCP